MEPIVQVKNLAKSFGSLQVLTEVNLEVYPGETVVILGGSGSGKSVLLQILLGLIPADKGEIWIHGYEVNRFQKEKDWDPVRLKTGFLFQAGGLYDSMTVYENITFAMRHHLHLSEREMRKRVQEILASIQLEGIEEKYPAELSGGMQKRVALARAIALNPPLILYDEPTSGLDPIRSAMISELIRKLQRTHGITSIIVTHDLHCAYKVADRVMLLYQGRIIAHGTVEEFKQSDNPYVRQFLEGKTQGPIEE
ncbi:MAG: ABC transporter ATP-binding protein [Candidatus Desulfofervidaceae bacterium]|nr:ABC transporter ATP-binding protein [Candidatus Desulfofervidaceae bacterium]